MRQRPLQAFVDFTLRSHVVLDRIGAWLPQLALRAIVGWEFLVSGLVKLRGVHWFASIHDGFPFPVDALPLGPNCLVATWAAVVGGLALWLGVATRFWSTALTTLTAVAIAAAHWPAEWHSLAELLRGCAVTDRGFGSHKLPLLLLVMLLPLIFGGAGKASIDHVLRLAFTRR